MYCQLVYICGCIPARIRHALADLPETLDETYERTLREINKADWEFAHRLFQFVAVAVRPLLVEELAELLAFDFKAGPIPKFHDDWRLEDPMHAVLSTCPSFLAIVDENPSWPSERKVVQFSHFSVKEFLTSPRLHESNDINLRRYHISETPAHTLAASACLGYLLHLDKDVTRGGLQNVTFAKYSAQHWDDHARFEDVSRDVKNGLKELFDTSKPHLAIYIWTREEILPSWERSDLSERPSPLNYAALWNLHFVVELLINELSENVNSRHLTDSATPLHVASKCGHIEVALKFIEHGASISAKDKDGCTPLHLASEKGKMEVVHMVIERGADVSAQDKVGRMPLHLAWEAEAARILLERGADVSARDKDGRTPLHLTRKAEVARMLIERGADVSAQDNKGHTPLHLASEVAHMLVELGADMSAIDKEGHTPLHLASHTGELEVADMLIGRGADMLAQDKHGHTPLHLASRAAKLKVVGMLIELGADVSAQDKDGYTPLHLALKACLAEVACMLIEGGADVSAQDKDGGTPLHVTRTAEVARMLIERGADVSARDKEDHTPLHQVSQAGGEPEVARMLIERGADVSAKNNVGRTPLHLTCHAGLETTRLLAHILIERSADMSAEDKDGHTPLHLALQAERLKFHRMLIERGADVSTEEGGRSLVFVECALILSLFYFFISDLFRFALD